MLRLIEFDFPVFKHSVFQGHSHLPWVSTYSVLEVGLVMFNFKLATTQLIISVE
jgi:hypothetical protein